MGNERAVERDIERTLQEKSRRKGDRPSLKQEFIGGRGQEHIPGNRDLISQTNAQKVAYRDRYSHPQPALNGQSEEVSSARSKSKVCVC
ncbi:hypothetical protein CLAFUW4_10124 [Fulvia fulva]|uniref:Uncharacterized protein n=1 Tax=Passalora fulva TaxID=5499 RepID=A0A9Q8P8K0_PASFU|nr:uncharacterized protein CLAFUR5_04738 [Fulvia fulva]KAK4615920.1 hypothetical protein CLAFUR4_10128 [Fulvia fulva]KAK4617215.1 hypothetical protein CLAFUR0_10126 [Fulvia fulva]UJO16981.1 hypothetical protein CLAFUR5_04738 [Fulvia fulva]WPV19086.1 hypothetical protein CLAFUW4_10124 [Fulvia fulva]WPV34305.1 hypothetical protein CLAFUW7_10125 [Fulvia fulva]